MRCIEGMSDTPVMSTAGLDPIDEGTLELLEKLTSAQLDAGCAVAEAELEKIRLLRIYGQIDKEKKAIFEKVLLDRGLAPDASISIDQRTGAITVK